MLTPSQAMPLIAELAAQRTQIFPTPRCSQPPLRRLLHFCSLARDLVTNRLVRRTSKHIHLVADQREAALQHLAPAIQLGGIIPPDVLERDDSPLPHLAGGINDDPALFHTTASERVDEQEIRLEHGAIVQFRASSTRASIAVAVAETVAVAVMSAAGADAVLQPF